MSNFNFINDQNVIKSILVHIRSEGKREACGLIVNNQFLMDYPLQLKIYL